MPVAVIGVALTAWIALTVVAAPYHVAGALLMTSAPGWFLVGLVRHRSRPAPILSSRVLVFTLAVFVTVAGLLFVAGGSPSSFTSFESEAWDANVAYAQVGPFVDVEHPPLEFAEPERLSLGPGPGPVRIERTWTTPAGFLDTWGDLRLEVWPAPPGMPNGPMLDPAATEPMATGRITFDGHRLTGAVSFVPRPDREHYHVATTGIGPDGVRMQLAWPGHEQWRWEGTVVDFARASLQP